MNKSNLTSKLILGTLVVSMTIGSATAGRLDSLKAFSGNAWDATKQYAGNAWDATKTYSGKAWDKTQPVRQYVKMPESRLGKASLAVGVTTAGLVGAGLVWKRYNKNAAPKVEVPVKAVAPKVDTSKIDCPAFVKALENAVAKKNVNWRGKFVTEQLVALGDTSVTTLVTELRTLIKANAIETEITTKLGEIKAKLA